LAFDRALSKDGKGRPITGACFLMLIEKNTAEFPAACAYGRIISRSDSFGIRIALEKYSIAAAFHTKRNRGEMLRSMAVEVPCEYSRRAVQIE
jgi:hypothetical protein